MMFNKLNKRCFLFFSCLFFSTLSLSVANVLFNDDTLEQTFNNFVLHTIKKRAIDSVYDLVSPQLTPDKLMNISGKAMQLIVPAITGLTIFAVFKISVILFTSIAIMVTLLPTLFGIAIPFTLDSLSVNLNELKKLDYNVITRSIKALPDKSFDYLDIKDAECRTRAVCETGFFISDKIPAIRTWINTYGDGIPLIDKYAKALMKGLQSLDCSITYSNCPNSPFKKFANLSTYFKR